MLLELLELASNKTLEHDPETRHRLEKLQGKTMTLHIKPIDQSISVTPYPEGLEFSSKLTGAADVTLSATIGAMVKITRDGMQDADLQPGELTMTGDPIIGQRFAQVLSELDVDWEGMLAEQFGESPAKAVTFAAEQAKLFAEESQAQLKQFFNRLITEDLDLVADKASVDSFLDEVDTIRADTDRLFARIKRLQNHG